MMTLPASNTAYVADYTHGKPSVQKKSIDLPSVEDNQVLVKTSYVAQNPTDVQSLDAKAFGDAALYGCDFTGEVVKTGDQVSRVKLGDNIAGLVWGGEVAGVGAYSHYTIADERICFKIPSSIDPAAASTIPLAVTTAWLMMFSKQCLNIDRSQKQTVLIWGGSSSVGQFAIQLAALYSFTIITTCSPRNFELVKKLGANHCFDYSSDDVVDQIKATAPDLEYVVDTIGSQTSSEAGSNTVGAAKGVLCTVRPGKANTEKVASHVDVTDVLVWTAFLKDHAYGEFRWPASKEDHELAAELYTDLPGWLEKGKIKPNAIELLKGLDQTETGFDIYRRGEYSAKKIVYKVGN